MASGLIFLILVFSSILIKSSDMVIVAIRRISRKSHTKLFAVSAIILAIGTSFPELFVGITSALEGHPEISLGDVTGSNIANISLVAGIAAAVAGKVTVRGNYLKRDVIYALLAGLLPMALLFDYSLSRVDGLILLAVYVAYATSFFRKQYGEIGKHHQKEVDKDSFPVRFFRTFNHVTDYRRELGKLFVGIALMLFAADAIVKLGTILAAVAGLPKLSVGLIIVAIGTSLPELAFSFRSLTDHTPSMFFGNLLGSTIANSTLVIGLVSVIHPIEVVAIDKFLVAAAAFVIIYISFWIFIRSKHLLERWEAMVLLLLYAVFVIVEIL